jgi:V8-like Glu-specific endopeptidase
LIKLEQQDFVNLVKVIENLPELTSTKERRQLIIASGLNDHRIISRLDWEGNSHSFAIQVVNFLASFGRISYDREALGVLLAYVREFIPDEEENAILLDNLMEKYIMNVALSKVVKVNQWHDSRGQSTIKEQIIGENTLRPIAFLEQALAASEAVLRLTLEKDNGKYTCGTGFLVSNDLILTNNHIIATRQEAMNTDYHFHYQLDKNGAEMQIVSIAPEPEGLFYTHKELDFSVIQLQGEPGKTFGSLRLKGTRVSVDQRVNIIQHPGGNLKQISMQNNFVAYADRHVLQYYTSTMPGSSGSPVLNNEFDVIGIHHSSGMLPEPGSGRRFLRNAGTTMSAVLDNLMKDAPLIYSKINKGK